MSDIETTEKNKNNFLPGQGSNSQEAAQRLQDIGSSILRAARDELYLGMRFLDVALSSFIYQMDAPVNLFPSIHCLESWCAIHAAFAMKKMPKWYRLVTVVMSLGVFASTLFIKQHVILDMFGGIAVFEIGYWIAGKIVPRLYKKVS